MKSKRFQLLLILAAAAILALAPGCNKDDKKSKEQETGQTKVWEGTSLKGKVEGTCELKADVTYTLEGALLIEDGSELTIPAGTVIKAKEGYENYILVLRGGKININGTADKPVKMIPDKDNAGSGYWGGLVINGKAPLTSGQKEFATEINASHNYGGDKADDNSGVITYLILDGTGAKSNDNIEHNGLTLNGVGSGTKIENIFILNSADDGIEFFGGSVNVSNLLVVNSEDDMFDFTQGYCGTLKNCYGRWESDFKSDEKDPSGIEADGNHDGEHASDNHQSDFTVENMTIELLCQFVMQDAIKIRRGAVATIKNALVKGGQAENAIDLKDGKGDAKKVNITYSVEGTTFTTETVFGGVPEDDRLITKDGNQKGCDKGLFGWTGYKF